MDEPFEKHDELSNKVQEANPSATSAPKSTKKKLTIIAAIVIVAIIASAVLLPSKFERVHNKCISIAGTASGGGDYFMLDTYPDVYENLDPNAFSYVLASAQDGALEAIRYANKELGFSGAVYSQMLETNALMGRQSAENKKYRVTWTYHPDDGLEVTYEKK